MNWSRGVKLALRAKNRLGFIDEILPMPKSTSPDLNKWTRNDYMVMSWLTFSMEQVISDSFIFASSTHDLWLDVTEQFGKSNAPLLYELQTSLSKIEQNNLSIAEYYGKLKNANEAAETKKLIQLICGLNKNYDNVKTNLLSIEPLPTVLKAYHILQQIKKQQSLTYLMVKIPDVSALYSNKQSFTPSRSFQPKKAFKKSKLDLMCDHCKRKGHSLDQCFKLVGVPDWYVNLKGKTFAPSYKFVANFTEISNDTSGILGASPLDMPSGSSGVTGSMDSIISTSNVQSVLPNSALWIIDTGASDHMVFSKSLFVELHNLDTPITIALPDGSYLWGPYQTPNLTGGRFILTILDDFSRVTWTHLITTKDQVFNIVQAFLVYIDNHYNTSVKFIRSDNGTVIVQHQRAAHFAAKGIIHQKSVPGNPQ
ncbi:uncharacterized protein LOC141714151 [Apium graveolens]|uniref:uncharacterized protein LOC141714151 n=1 Tax=Apium graveolens TaxID=4045 RepID=UPI003D7AA363